MQKIKKLTAVLLSTIMILSVFAVVPFTVNAAEYKYGDFTYKILNQTDAEITGYNGDETNVRIPSEVDGYKVTSIGGRAFSNCTSLTNITIPDSVTEIRYSAFEGCTGLTSVTIPNSVTSIGNFAFSGCTSLTSVTIPNSVTSIGDFAFSNCTSLTSVTIPNNVTSIDDRAFMGCTSLTSVTIPNNVTSIGYEAFRGCTSLASVTIPNSVTSIGWGAFEDCESLTSVTIPNSVTIISNSAFQNCSNLTSVTIPNSVTSIGCYVFESCTSLTSITIPNSVTRILMNAFESCTSLTNVTIPDSVIEIGSMAFNNCTSLTNVYYTGSKEQWNKISIDFGNYFYRPTIHYNITGKVKEYNGHYYKIFDKGLNWNEAKVYCEKLGGHLVTIASKEEQEFIISILSDTQNYIWLGAYENNGKWEWVTQEEWSYTNWGIGEPNNYLNRGEDCLLMEKGTWNDQVSTGDPTGIKVENISFICEWEKKDDIQKNLLFTSTFDTKQYYSDGGFYSEVSSVSDCVELYLLLENDITGIDGELYSDEAKAHFKDISPIKLTATVSGDDLSFSRDSYQNTYDTTLDGIPVGKAVDDILMLFPHNINIAPWGNSYTVKVTLESESFDTITEEYTFTIEYLESKSANEHISFTSSNDDYKMSKKNIYGEEMATLKNDAEYKWSKFSSFDFDNYYEVVFADILVELMNVNQMGHLSLLPVIKEWVGNYKTILSAVSEIVEEDNTTGIKIPDNAVDKLLKKSKYITDGMNVDDELRDLVVKKLHEKVSIDKINSAFAVVDKTQQFYSFFKLGINITNDIADYINSVSILNTYKEMNDDFKTVIKQLYNNIPDSEKKLKNAVNHYVNLDTSFGQSDEYFTEVISLSKDITLDVFKTVYKAQFSAALLKSVGSITIKGAALSSTAAFSSITTGLSAGTALGFCISDVLCNNSGKAAELGKTIAMSEFSPYVINTLNHYESKLYSERNDASVAEFENAFALHKATQSYIMEHTVKALETKRDSIIIKLFSRDDYDGLISDTLATKSSIDNLKCHYDINQGSTVTSRTKVIAIKCPVNVFVYDETGAEIVRIVNDITEYFAQGINVFVEDGKKYIALPTSQKYSLKIVATDEGAMEYIVTEYNDGVERLRTVKMNEIPLTDGKIFTGEIVESTEVESDSYALKILGDTNGDGRLSVIDATLIQKYSASIEEITGDKLEVSDVNKDGAVNVMDATEIQKYLADLSSVLV